MTTSFWVINMQARILIEDPLGGTINPRFKEGDTGTCWENGREDDYKYTVRLGDDEYMFKRYEIVITK